MQLRSGKMIQNVSEKNNETKQHDKIFALLQSIHATYETENATYATAYRKRVTACTNLLNYVFKILHEFEKNGGETDRWILVDRWILIEVFKSWLQEDCIHLLERERVQHCIHLLERESRREKEVESEANFDTWFINMNQQYHHWINESNKSIEQIRLVDEVIFHVTTNLPNLQQDVKWASYLRDIIPKCRDMRRIILQKADKKKYRSVGSTKYR